MTHAFRCAEIDRFVDAYVDGEFSDEDRHALEQHVADCASCERRVHDQAAWQAAVRRAAPRPRLDAAARARIVAALDDEDRRGARTRRLAWVAAPALAAAAALIITLGLRPADPPLSSDARRWHERDVPMDVRGNEQVVSAWIRQNLGFAVRPPRIANGSLVGARLANVSDRQAAYLLYDVGGERVSVMVFQPGDLRLAAPERRSVGGRDVFLDARSGLRVVLFRDHDMGWAITSDMDEDHMLQLVSTAVGH